MSGTRKGSSTPGPGFLGLTSSSVYVDYGGPRQHGLRDVDKDDDLINGAVDAVTAPTYSQDQLNAGAAVLQQVFEYPLFESLLDEYRRDAVGVNLISPWITFICDSIKTNLYEALQSCEETDREILRYDLSHALFRNTSVALEYDGNCTLKYFASLFTGQNLRWEIVGLFFAGAGLGAITSRGRTRRPTTMDTRHRSALARRMLEAGQVCLGFSEHIGHMVDPEMWLSLELAHLASVVDGDSSKGILLSTFTG